MASKSVANNRSRSQRLSVQAVTATALAEHLGVSRQYISRLVEDGTIVRFDNGLFDQDRARLAYLTWLRDPARRAVKNEAESAFLKAKTLALDVRNAQRLGQLVPRDIHDEMLDGICGLYNSELSSLSARVTRDTVLRASVDKAVYDIRKSISAKAAAMASSPYPEVGENTGED